MLPAPQTLIGVEARVVLQSDTGRREVGDRGQMNEEGCPLHAQRFAPRSRNGLRFDERMILDDIMIQFF